MKSKTYSGGGGLDIFLDLDNLDVERGDGAAATVGDWTGGGSLMLLRDVFRRASSAGFTLNWMVERRDDAKEGRSLASPAPSVAAVAGREPLSKYGEGLSFESSWESAALVGAPDKGDGVGRGEGEDAIVIGANKPMSSIRSSGMRRCGVLPTTFGGARSSKMTHGVRECC